LIVKCRMEFLRKKRREKLNSDRLRKPGETFSIQDQTRSLGKSTAIPRRGDGNKYTDEKKKEEPRESHLSAFVKLKKAEAYQGFAREKR